MKHPLIIAAVAVAMLLPTSCANKKRIAREQAQVHAEAQRLIEAERQRVQDSIALAQAEELARLQRQLELERQEAERQRIQDSIAQAEAARRAIVQTLNIPRMTITLGMQGQQFTTPATMRWQRGTGLAVSIQPFAGLEMFRLEVDAQNVTIIDKINRRYTRLNYDDLAKMGAATTIDQMDAWIDKNIIDRRNEPQLVLQATRAGVNGSAVIYTAYMQTDVRINMRPTNIDTYRQVTLEQMLGGMIR